MLRNLVQQITRNYRIEIGNCQHCGTKESLEAAHVHGRNRNDIIDNILVRYTNNSVITIDLASLEKHFRDAHHILDGTIVILCKKCHSKYDANHIISEEIIPFEGIQMDKNDCPINKEMTYERLFSNQEIQRQISQVAKTIADSRLKQLCDKRLSKELFDINFPLFVSVPKNSSSKFKDSAVKDQKGNNRWTWKYEFENNGFLYAITTQWYSKHDNKVKEWLLQNKI